MPRQIWTARQRRTRAATDLAHIFLSTAAMTSGCVSMRVPRIPGTRGAIRPPTEMAHPLRRAGWRLEPSVTLSPLVPALWFLSLNLAGCAVVKGIFKAGVWVGVLSACAVLGLFVYGASRLGRRS